MQTAYVAGCNLAARKSQAIQQPVRICVQHPAREQFQFAFLRDVGQLRPIQPEFLSLKRRELFHLQTLLTRQSFPRDARHCITRYIIAQAGKILVARCG